jgi:nickel superoxide dismutase
MKKIMVLLIIIVHASFLHAHCQIPCGIYDDELRFKQLHEHITTIEKSMTSIHSLSQSSSENNPNQLTRWVINKEDHADKIMHIIHDYFLAQRVKPLSENATKKERRNYQKQLQLIHEITIDVMKSKQTTDINYTTQLHRKLSDFQTIYTKN